MQILLSIQLLITTAHALISRRSVLPSLSCDVQDDAGYGTVLHLSTDSGRICYLSTLNSFGKVPTISLLTEGKPIASYFSVRNSDRALVTKNIIDREKLCQATKECCKGDSQICEFDLQVSVVSDSVEIRRITVRVIDRNDHSPHFPSQHHILRIPEVTPASTQFPLPYATDEDTFPFSIATYKMEPMNSNFELVQQDDFLTRKPKIKLQLKNMLDREEQSLYTFVVKAIDRGNPPKTGTMTLSVEVIDSNDHVPRFRQTLYTVNVSENVAIGTQLLQIQADDKDEGINAQIDYDISSMAEKEVFTHFVLDRSSGWLTVKSSLDYETTTSYVFKIQATDRGSNPNKDEATIQINVKDVNDCSPKISVDYISKSGALPYVTESSLPMVKEVIAVVSVNDNDGGKAGEVSCKVLKDYPNNHNAEKFYLEEIGKKSYKLTLNGTVDREERSEERFRICCSDHGFPSLSQCKSAVIKIRDVNDEAPKFTQESITTYMLENLPQHREVIRVHAIDKDEEPNNILNYSIDKPSQEFFAISSQTGQITSKKSFDRERQSQYTIVVTATDNGKLSASTTVTVKIKDVNDEIPKFTGQNPQNSFNYVFEVEENVKHRTVIGQVKAEDNDDARFGELRYSWIPSSHTTSFDIDSNTGTISAIQPLDREDQSSYNLKVLVVDNPRGTPQNSVTASVRVVVLDENDCFPVIQFPTDKNNTFPVSYKEQANQLILQVRAHDEDEGANGILHYELRATDRSSGLFFIDASDGNIRISRQMTEADIGRYHFIIRVQDSGTPKKSTETSIIVSVDRSQPSSLGHEDYTDYQPRQSPPSLLLVTVVAVTCLLVLLLLVLTLYLCHRRGMLLDGTFFCIPPANTPRNVEWKEDRAENISFLTQQRVPENKQKLASVNSSLRRSDDTVITLTEGQYTTLNGGKMVRNSSNKNKKSGKLLQGRLPDSCPLDWGYYEAGCEGEPPAYYDLETRSRTLAGSGSKQDTPQTDQMSRKKLTQDLSMYDLLHAGNNDQTLAHQGKVYSIPKASFV